MHNVLSLDVEEWFHVYNLRDRIRRDDWESLPSRVVDSTRAFLDLLDEGDARGTFFVLGWVAERQPDLVAEIARRGHEIASHGYGHDVLTELDADAFERDLERTESILEGIVGTRPLGYRAPSFTVMPGTWWALDVLFRRGYRYDSSVFPVARERYGCPDAPRHIGPARRDGDRVLWSFPLLTRRVGLAARNLPLAGGGYLRLFPVQWIASAVRAMNAAGHPAMLYLHPWELDPDQPLPDGIPALKRFMHTVNLSRTARKIRYLVRRFAFATALDVLDAELARRPELARTEPPAVLFP